MDDTCAVCAETLEWVAYGSCGHKEVCSTCVARLRFICLDRRCCICKTDSPIIFITKALGDYTRTINDFSVLPTEVKEGRVGSYWYHEDTQGYFDDFDHYKMVKAMCRLSCSVCDKMEEQTTDGHKRRARFRSIDQLKGHLFHQHRKLMCTLCLEGRKVFICEQKLYTREQLKQHISTGDSEVDGTESERGGFMGHPLCEFCRSPFYGDNELFTHMSTEHYTCHICQRQHPGQYEYYKNYNDLEIHFRQDHFLCEDESCLAKKFIVFQSEAEMKRHNTLEHGGRMSRSQRNAALQIPTSFRYRRNNEQDNRHGRGRGRMFRRDASDADLSRAIEASYGTANPIDSFNDPLPSNAPVISDHGETSDVDRVFPPLESTTTTDLEPPSRYRQAVSNRSRNAPLEESAFPPLASAPPGSQPRPTSDHEIIQKNTMAENLHRQNKKKVNILNSSQGHSRPSIESFPSLVPVSVQSKPVINQRSGRSSYSSFVQPSSSSSSSIHDEVSSTSSSTSSRNWGNNTGRMSHSSSAPNLVEVGSTSDFPPVSATVQLHKQKVDEVHTANKSMVEKLRSALEFDEDKFAAFKEISGEYRQGSIDAATYLAYVQQFGLTHLVLDLAKLCPDPKKEKELVAAYNASLGNRARQENGFNHGTNKGKKVVGEKGNVKDKLADDILSTVRKLQLNQRISEEGEVETLSKDGYRTGKGKSNLVINEARAVELNSPGLVLLKGKGDGIDFRSSGGGGSNQSSTGGDSETRSKQQRKKTSKFRLGDGSIAVLLDAKYSDPPGSAPVSDGGGGQESVEGLPIRGVWKNGGGHKLVAKTSKGTKN